MFVAIRYLAVGTFVVLAVLAGFERSSAQPGIRRSESSVIRLEAGAESSRAVDRRLTVEIGDSTSAQFESVFEMTGWGNQAKFRVGLAIVGRSRDAVTRQLTSRNDQPMTRLIGDSRIHELYVRSDGNLEWNVILNDNPGDTVLCYPLELDGLTAYYQGPLSAEELADGARRPDSVVGSYAVYHSFRRGDIILGDGRLARYRTGKAFHIYRPKVWDSRGDTVWGTLQIDTTARTLSVSLDHDWLEAATYPVTIDPTFGKTDIGGSTKSLVGRWRGGEFTCTSAGDADSISIYVANACDIGAAVYADNSGLPGSLIDSSTVAAASGGAGWVSFASALTPSYTVSTTYHVGGIDAGSDPIMAYDDGSTEGSYYPGSWPPSDPANSPSESTRIYSAYVTYSSGGGSEPTVAKRRRLLVKGN